MKNITPPSSLIPETAPFSPEQRSWLNGFFAACLSVDSGVTPIAFESGDGVPGSVDSDDGEAPWHDQTLALDARMKLAEGRPLRRRMMAAMAQQDCGQCGYDCESYAEALATGKEARLNLCAPGGKDTARMLKTLASEQMARRAGRPFSRKAGARAGRARAFAGQSRAGHVSLATPAQWRRFREGDLAHRRSTSLKVGSITRRATVSASLSATIPVSPTRSSRRWASLLSRRCAARRCAII